MKPLTPTATLIAPSDPLDSAVHHPSVLACELSPADRQRLLAHFLALNEDDLLLRFGQIMPSHMIEHYANGIDFSRDTVFGVFDDRLELLGVGHLAYLPSSHGKGEHTAELGVSVLERARGHGIGTQLFERAAMRSRNTHITNLYMHCLSRNSTMMRIAKKAGMKIEHAHGEADAYLRLPPADQSSMVTELLQEQAAVFDYAMKHYARRAPRLFDAFCHAPSAGLAV